MTVYPPKAAAFLLLFLLPGCCKDSSPDIPDSAYSTTANITKGSTVKRFNARGRANVLAVKKSSLCTIASTDTTGGIATRLTFRIANFKGEGRYVFDSGSASTAFFEAFGPSFSQTTFANADVLISEITPQHVSGIFSGTLTDGSVITEGKFTVPGSGF